MSEDADRQRKELTAIVADQVAKYSEAIKEGKKTLRHFEENHLHPLATIRLMREELRRVENWRRSLRVLLKEIPNKEEEELAFLLRLFGKVEGRP
jgi:DNA-directed RNA polymerase subunit F